MPATVFHVKTATSPDDPLFEINPSNWNSVHQVSVSLLASEIASLFSNANGISFGLSGTAITGSYTVPITTGFAGTGFTSTTTAGTEVEATLGTNGLSMAVPAFLTTARASTDAVGLNTAQTNVTWTVNSSGISLNASRYAGTGFTSTTTAGTEIEATNNTLGLSMAVPAFLTTARASNDGIGLNTAQTNVTWTVNSSGISLNAGGYAGTGYTSTTTAGTAIVGTHNTAGLSIGVPAFLTTARGSTDAVGLATAQTNVTWTVNSNGISLNAGGYAGTGFTSTTTAGTEVEATLNTAGLSMAVPAFLTTAAVGATLSAFEPFPFFGALSTFSYANNQLDFQPCRMEVNYSFSKLYIPVAVTASTQATASAQVGVTLFYAMYSRNATNQSRLDTVITTSVTMLGSHNSNVSMQFNYDGTSTSSGGTGVSSVMHGNRMYTANFAGSFTPGEYFFAKIVRTSAVNASISILRPLFWQLAFEGVFNSAGYPGQASNASMNLQYGHGSYSVTTSGFPASVAVSDIRNNSQQAVYFKLYNYNTAD